MILGLATLAAMGVLYPCIHTNTNLLSTPLDASSPDTARQTEPSTRANKAGNCEEDILLSPILISP